ncbi:MAG: DUF4160 domain-containing protein [Roseburia sp.]|nr:DUF4160 domain-containing protein [Roseburia sp.]
MPEISRFYGILIKMYFTKAEHNPPHFHAIYGEKMAEIDINTLKVIVGDLPQKALAIVLEWAQKYQDDLLRIWESQVFTAIPPLE